MKDTTQRHPCKRWYGYKHDWHKALYSEYDTAIRLRPRDKYYHDAQLYGTKQCAKCGMFADGFAEKDHPILTPN